MTIHNPAAKLLALLQPLTPSQMFQNGAANADELAFHCEGEAITETKAERRAYLLSEARRHRERANFYRSRMEMIR